MVDLSSPTQATVADPQGIGTITNDDVLPALFIDNVTAPEGNAGATPFVFTVSLSNPSATSITVDATASDGSATQLDTDYAPAGQTLTFLPGEVSKTFAVNVNGDTTPEPNETFNVALTAPTNATIADPGGLGTITNDDFPPGTVGVLVDDVTLAEGTGAGTTSFTFTLSLTGPTTAATSVDITTVDGSATVGDSDYTTNTQTVNFPSGQSGPQTVTVLVGRDSKYEADETFSISLSGATGPLIVLDDTGLGTVDNDDAMPTISIDDVAELEGNSGTTPLEFTVALTPASGVAATVQLTTADVSATVGDADYAAAGATVTFLPGETSKTVTVAATGDTKYEPDETFDVALAAPVGATIVDAAGIGTILNDDDEPTIAITDVDQFEGNVGTSSFAFSLSLSNPSSETVTVDADTADGTALVLDGDYVAASPAVTFPPGNVSQSVTVTVTGDTDPESDETFEVALSGAQNASTTDTGIGTILNDDVPPGASGVSIGDVSVTEGNAGTTNAVFTIALSLAAPADTSVTVATSDGTATVGGDDYEFATQVVTIPAGLTSGTFAVAVNGDTTPEANETFTATLSNAVGLTITDPAGVGTIVNDDVVNEPNPDPLAIQVPGNIVKDADPNQNGAVVTYPAPTTTGGTAPVAVSCSHASGAFYPLGVTTVTCTATDSAPDEPPPSPSSRNDSVRVVAALTASGTFTITVNQVDPGGTIPVTTIPSSTIPGATLPPELFPPTGQPGGFPSAGPTPGLPETGSNVADMLVLAAVAVTLGGILLLIRRRTDRPGRSAS